MRKRNLFRQHDLLRDRLARAERQEEALRESKFFTMARGMESLGEFEPASLDGLIGEKLDDYAKELFGVDYYRYLRRQALRIEYGA